jgi:hypothetical protein
LERRFNQQEPTGIFEGIFACVDGVECPIQRPADYYIQRIYYSGKKKRHTIKYQVSCRINDGYPLHVTLGVPGSVHDLTLFKMSSISEVLFQDEFFLADKGYQGHTALVIPFKQASTTLTPHQQNFNSVISSVRQVVEHCIGRIKIFKCLTTPWRHDLYLHQAAFSVCTKITALKCLFYPVHKAHNPYLYM